MDSETLLLLARSNRNLSVARATLSANVAGYTSGNTIVFNSTSANYGFGNVPTLNASGQLVPNYPGIYLAMLGVNAGATTGSFSSYDLRLAGSISSTLTNLARSEAGAITATTTLVLVASTIVQLGAADYIYGTFVYGGATAVTLNAVPETFLALAFLGGL